jgi:excisionase family DNA binding protein
VKEMCEMLRIGQNKAYELLLKHEIPAIRMGRKYVIAKEHVIKYIRKKSS